MTAPKFDPRSCWGWWGSPHLLVVSSQFKRIEPLGIIIVRMLQHIACLKQHRLPAVSKHWETSLVAIPKGTQQLKWLLCDNSTCILPQASGSPSLGTKSSPLSYSELRPGSQTVTGSPLAAGSTGCDPKTRSNMLEHVEKWIKGRHNSLLLGTFR